MSNSNQLTSSTAVMSNENQEAYVITSSTYTLPRKYAYIVDIFEMIEQVFMQNFLFTKATIKKLGKKSLG